MLSKTLVAIATFLVICAGTAVAGPPDRAKAPKASGAQPKSPSVQKSFTGQLLWVAPQGGEVFCRWGSYPLIWTGGDSQNVSFRLISMRLWQVVDGAPEGTFDNTGKLTWQVPSHVEPGDYQMYVERADGRDWRYSGTFRILECGCN